MFISRPKYNSDINDAYIKGYNEGQAIIRQQSRDLTRYKLEVKLLNEKLKHTIEIPWWKLS